MGIKGSFLRNESLKVTRRKLDCKRIVKRNKKSHKLMLNVMVIDEKLFMLTVRKVGTVFFVSVVDCYVVVGYCFVLFFPVFFCRGSCL